jgi:hypothetical protein
MPELITTTAIAKASLGALQENQKWIINYFLVSFFWKYYKNYLRDNILIHREAETEAAKELEKRMQNIESNPNPILIAVQKESEIEYRNMFWVLQKVASKVSNGVGGQIDPDKMKRLKDLSKEFSSDDMQEIIASILAGEYNTPWTYSLKTMDIVKNLSREDINLFRKFWGLVVNGEFVFWSFFELWTENHKKLISSGIGYKEYLYLQELWLFSGSNSGRNMGDLTWIEYHYTFKIANRKIIFKQKWEFTIQGMSYLTQAGKDLFSLVDPLFDEELFSITKNEFERLWLTEV